MNPRIAVCWLVLLGATTLPAQPVLKQEPNTWVKRSPLAGGPVSPGMGYETSLGYDSRSRLVIRWGGHNQGGGGEQNAETWTLDPLTGKWTLREPNTSPPGVCCAQQNVFDLDQGRFLRFPAFSGSHGWHWFRENYLSNSTVWSYDLPTNTWRDLRPEPTPRVAPLRCASWDSDHGVAVVFGGEGSNEGTLIYDPHSNTWTRMHPKTEPAGRSGGNMTYDAAHKVHVLFGSQFGDDRHTWTYDLRKNEWRDAKPATQPPTKLNDAVLAYDPNSRAVIALVRAADAVNGMNAERGHLETWAYDAGKNTWTRKHPEREPDGWGNRRRVMIALPDLNVLLSEHYVNPSERVPNVDREQQIWTYRHAGTKPLLLPPVELSVKTEAKAAVLSWPRVASATGYVVHRGTGEQPWLAPMRQAAKLEAGVTTWRDAEVKPGTRTFYQVRSLGKDGESGPGPLGRTQPRVVEDAVVSVVSAKEVRLKWKAPAEVVGYHVERAVVEVFSEDEIKRLRTDTPPLEHPSVGTVKAIGAFERLTKAALAKPEYVDTALDLTKPLKVEGEPMFTHRFPADRIEKEGKPYRFAVFAYRVRAVNALGVESGPSPYWLTIPSAPQSLFAKEEGETCHLKWSANPETGIKGYRVYRMEGPKINGPGQKVTRLMVDPVKEPRYTDQSAGKDTRRFWVVAVDALGQEGIPSAPAWHQRQFRKFYVPFTSDWHQ